MSLFQEHRGQAVSTRPSPQLTVAAALSQLPLWAGSSRSGPSRQDSCGLLQSSNFLLLCFDFLHPGN